MITSPISTWPYSEKEGNVLSLNLLHSMTVHVSCMDKTLKFTRPCSENEPHFACLDKHTIDDNIFFYVTRRI